MHLDEIDWEEMWKEKQHISNLSPEPVLQEQRWDQMASWYKFWSEHDEYPTKLLQRIQMDRDWSVLDIGCGIGAISIAAAIRTDRVTSLDISENMLAILRADAERRHLGNIRYLHQSWEDVRIGPDIKAHDVVIASRAIARTRNLMESLQKINLAARKYAYVTAWGGETGDFTREFLTAIGREYINSPDDIFVYNILHRMGIRPNIEQLECRNLILYKNHDQAFQSYQVLLHITQEETDAAHKFLKEHLKRRKDGKYETPEVRTWWSLIWWKKQV
jgi:SAM-dependent methyltransferase